MFAYGYTGSNDGIGAYPAFVLNSDLSSRTFLETDRGVNICIAVIQAGQDDVLCEDYMIADLYRSDQNIAEPDRTMFPDNDISHAVIDTGEVLDDAMTAEDKLPEGQHI